ncbi:hypothetical protein KPZU09_10540 [Klebsiella pneumoniae]|uniref:ABC transporter substrate-binding protein n=1 Tax=Klebsiella pneumoniae TaxID=573 RepID=A0A919HMN9_KLEPN|nr:hypothetical protein KPZU09_10540 [Klebsiella pneumoniae]
MNTVMTVKKGVVLAMALSAMMLSSAHALTVYTAGPGSLAKSPASGFEQQTGVKVTVFQATTGKVMARLEAEQANPQADVLISASWDTAEDLHQRGWLLPLRAPTPTGTGEPEIGGLYRPGVSAPVLSGTVKAAPRNRKSGGISPSRRLKTR